MNRREWVLDQNEDATFLQKKLDSALIGVHNRYGAPPTACYDLNIIGNRAVRISGSLENRPTFVRRLDPEAREAFFESNPDLLLATGHDDEIIGVSMDFQGNVLFVVYDYEKFLKRFMGDGMNYEEAVEFFDFNTIGAWVGEKTPGFVTIFEDLGEVPEPGLTELLAKQ